MRLGHFIGQKTIFTAKDRRRSSEGKQSRQVAPPLVTIQSEAIQHCTQIRKKREAHARCTFGRAGSHDSKSNEKSRDRSYAKSRDRANTFDNGILVRENTKTVKVDNTSFLNTPKSKKAFSKTNSDGHLKNHRWKKSYVRRLSAENRRGQDLETCKVTNHIGDGVRNSRESRSNSQLNFSGAIYVTSPRPSTKDRQHKTGSITSDTLSAKTTEHGQYRARDQGQGRSDSIVSTCSTASECQSTFSTSDITLSMPSALSRENSYKRPKSAPGPFLRTASSGSLPNMIINNFVASSPDNFRSHGAWRFLVEYKGKWESMCYLFK